MDGDLFDLPRVLIVASVWVGTNCSVLGTLTLETKWFFLVVFPVCTLGAPRINKGKIHILFLLG